jgi:hypothetical protein
MIPTIVYLLIRCFIRRYPGRIKGYLFVAGKILLWIALGLAICRISFSQNRVLVYDVLKGGKNIGTVKVQCNTYDEKKSYKLESNIKTRFILSFVAESLEEAIFQNGIVTYASLYRKLNGDEKVNKKMILTEQGYQLLKDGTKKQLSFSGIQANILSLYDAEPLDIKQVYSDNYQRYLKIKKAGAHVYELILPDGTSNQYHYQNGICYAIEIKHSLYRATVQLKN